MTFDLSQASATWNAATLEKRRQWLQTTKNNVENEATHPEDISWWRENLLSYASSSAKHLPPDLLKVIYILM